jgi:hypothetical protein
LRTETGSGVGRLEHKIDLLLEHTLRRPPE